MLISFSLRNFKSFKNETILEMMPERSKSKNNCIRNDCLRIAEIYGNNASGKSNLIEGLKTLKTLVTDPYFCGSESLTNWESKKSTIEGRITSFRIEFSVESRVYIYELGVSSEIPKDIDERPSKVFFIYPMQYERLSFYDTKYEPYKDGSVSITRIFEHDPRNLIAYLESENRPSRRWHKTKHHYCPLLNERRQLIHQIKVCNSTDYTYNINLEKNLGKSDENINEIIRKRARNNQQRFTLRKKIDRNLLDLKRWIFTSSSPYIPLLLQSDLRWDVKEKYDEHQQAFMNDVRDWFSSKLVILGTSDIYLPSDDETFRSLSEIMHDMDLGIEDIEWRKINSIIARKIIDSLSEEYRLIILNKNEINQNGLYKSSIIKTQNGIYRYTSDNKKWKLEELYPKHLDHSVRELFSESDGTVRMIELSSILIPTNEEIVFVVDELDRRLHPLLTRKIIESFLSDCSKFKQLIITTHETEILTTDLFRKDEIWFVQKDGNSSWICSLDELSCINYNKRLERLYLENEILPKNPNISSYQHRYPWED